MDILNIHFLQSFYIYIIFLLPIFCYLFFIGYKTNSLNLNLKFDEKNIFHSNIFITKIFLLFFILLVFILILSNPYKLNIKEKIKKNGIDIVVVFDVSKSMDGVDLKPTRIEKSKKVLKDFIKKQKTNRVGLVIFSGKPLVGIPLSFDYEILIESINNLTTGSLSGNSRILDGTSIGDALLLSKTLFKDSTNREKAIILITDGDANKGSDPSVVADLLKQDNIKIYSVGIGSEKGSFIELNNGFFYQKVPVPPLNSSSLENISSKTGGYFFRATDDKAIEKIFEKLEVLEKNDIEVEVEKDFKPYYYPFVYLLLFLISVLLFLEIRRVKV